MTGELESKAQAPIFSGVTDDAGRPVTATGPS
jgi:hypothetical protein